MTSSQPCSGWMTVGGDHFFCAVTWIRRYVCQHRDQCDCIVFHEIVWTRTGRCACFLLKKFKYRKLGYCSKLTWLLHLQSDLQCAANRAKWLVHLADVSRERPVWQVGFMLKPKTHNISSPNFSQVVLALAPLSQRRPDRFMISLQQLRRCEFIHFI